MPWWNSVDQGTTKAPPNLGVVPWAKASPRLFPPGLHQGLAQSQTEDQALGQALGSCSADVVLAAVITAEWVPEAYPTS